MMNESEQAAILIREYLEWNPGNEQARNKVAPGIQYFDPLYAAVTGADVFRLREYESSFPGFKLELGEVTDEGEGYYTVPWVKEYTYPVTGRSVKVAGKSYLQLEHGKIVGHSEAFSLHRWAKDAYGIAGWFFGSIFFFQRKMRREAARQLSEFVS